MHWKEKIYKSAYTVAESFKDDPRVLGIAIGGSVAKNVVWKHSDLELGIVVDERIKEYEYFNFIEGLGVEIIQIKKSDIIDFTDNFTQPDEKLLKFPIQIYKCRIIYDPQNIIKPFKEIYDNSLFHTNIASIKESESLGHADGRYEQAKSLFEKGNFNTALSHLRIAINALLLAYYWHYSILPRSQNRTVYFLKKNSAKIGHDVLYNAFVDIFCLNKTLGEMQNALASAKPEIFSVSKAWGESAPDFLEKAVDINLEWGYPKSITYVYKWCMHILQCSDLCTEDYCDTTEYKNKYPNLYEFLDFSTINMSDLEKMLAQYQDARKMLQ